MNKGTVPWLEEHHEPHSASRALEDPTGKATNIFKELIDIWPDLSFILKGLGKKHFRLTPVQGFGREGLEIPFLFPTDAVYPNSIPSGDHLRSVLTGPAKTEVCRLFSYAFVEW